MLRFCSGSVPLRQLIGSDAGDVRSGHQNSALKSWQESPFRRSIRNACTVFKFGTSQNVFEQRQRQLGFQKRHLGEFLNHHLFDRNFLKDGVTHLFEFLRKGLCPRSCGKRSSGRFPGLQDFRHKFLGFAIASFTHVGHEGKRFAFQVIGKCNRIHSASDDSRSRIGSGVGCILHSQFVINLSSDVDDQHQQDRKHEDGKH